MKITEFLAHEHRVIEKMLECLEKITDRAAAEGVLARESASPSLDFFRKYADRCHHGKEEDLLFPMMEARGVTRKTSPLGGMLFDHILGRSLVRAMAKSLEEGPSSKAVAEFQEASRDFIRLLRRHIDKEDHVLFPLADQVLNERDQESLSVLCAKVEHEKFGPDFHREYISATANLARRLGMAPPTIEPW